jgi:hypothetical protein
MAKLLRPEIVLRHISETPERTDAPRLRNAPAGFFEDLAVERLDRGFARVNPAPGKLKLRLWFCLVGEEKIRPARKDRVDACALPVSHTCLDRFADPPDHLLGPSPPIPI